MKISFLSLLHKTKEWFYATLFVLLKWGVMRNLTPKRVRLGKGSKSLLLRHQKAIKKISPGKALIFQGFFAFFGRNFLVRFCK